MYHKHPKTLPPFIKFVGVLYPGYRGSLVMVQKSGYNWFPLVANSWGTIHPVPDMTPLLMVEEGGPLPQKEPNPGAIPANTLPHLGSCRKTWFCHLSACSMSFPRPGMLSVSHLPHPGASWYQVGTTRARASRSDVIKCLAHHDVAASAHAHMTTDNWVLEPIPSSPVTDASPKGHA
jgi:hypothetical protein